MFDGFLLVVLMMIASNSHTRQKEEEVQGEEVQEEKEEVQEEGVQEEGEEVQGEGVQEEREEVAGDQRKGSRIFRRMTLLRKTIRRRNKRKKT